MSGSSWRTRTATRGRYFYDRWDLFSSPGPREAAARLYRRRDDYGAPAFTWDPGAHPLDFFRRGPGHLVVEHKPTTQPLFLRDRFPAAPTLRPGARHLAAYADRELP